VKVKDDYMGENELSNRLFKFSIEIIKMLRSLKGGNDISIIAVQLSKSATSCGEITRRPRELFQDLTLQVKLG